MKSMKSERIFKYKITYTSGQIIEFWADSFEISSSGLRRLSDGISNLVWNRNNTLKYGPEEFKYPAPNEINPTSIESVWIVDEKSVLVPIE